MVSTRFAGFDGVSLESAKVAAALGSAGFDFVWWAGVLGDEFTPGKEVPQARFDSEANLVLEAACFGDVAPGADPRKAIRERADSLEHELRGFIDDFEVDALLVQNALAIPMQLPLGVALTNLITDTGIPAVAHHHDFSWERERFAACAVPDILERSFPPVADSLAHAVINHAAARQLKRRRKVAATVLPNVMDFEHRPEPGDGARYRASAGLSERDIVLLQPTRIIARKGIELTIELAHRLRDLEVKVVASHPDDLDSEYWGRLRLQAERLEVDLRLAAATDLADAYAAADLVCFPSLYEGFGNALLEAFFYRKPAVVNRYPVYVEDIAPSGVRCIEIDGEITDSVAAAARSLLADNGLVAEMVAHNEDVGRRHFSYEVVRRRLGPLLRR